jgi:hypothetical protein
VTDIIEKLKRLYALAKLSDDERKLYADDKLDDGRLNEARTSAFLLLHIARTNNVTIRFEMHGSEGTAAPAGPFGSQNWGRPSMRDLDEILRRAVRREQEVASAREERERQERFKRDFSEERERRRSPSPASNSATAGNWVADPAVDPFFTHVNEHVPGSWSGAVPPFQRPQSRPTGKWQTKKEKDPKSPPLITAQFPGVCMACQKPYAQGEQVWWMRNVGSTHGACGFAALQKT